MKDSFKLQGEVVIERRNKEGITLDREVKKNLIVNVGKEYVAKLLGDTESGLTPFTALAIGTGTTSPIAGDTSLETEITRATISPVYEANYKVKYEKTFEFGSGETYDITEAGIFNSIVASGSDMLNRVTFDPRSVDVDTDFYIKITITIS